ncbi:hypothetical protein [Paenibacillus arenilitoris]|uniref:Uncharacterized protein n=1 Tax=Paenibacillus arenilitoris TaxID=2772299 RepID=A0A927H8B1_9BACL|nr:hypothetical protein [Paenibacillus arenilitoris]MBD2871382.1 hypothetical protein [Paenibacillus arenilitoris]
MEDTLLNELRRFAAALERKDAAAVYAVPDADLHAVKKAKSLEKLLHDIFMQASGSGGIDLRSILRREFGIRGALMDRFAQWAPHSKEQFEDALHDAIDRADIRAGNQGAFFAGTPGKKEAAEALSLLKEIAHAAVSCKFRAGRADPEPYVVMLDRLLQFYALPNTYPEGNAVQYRNLIAADRLRAMAGGREPIAAALKASAKAWYQQSPHRFLESREGYVSHDVVRQYLYALTEEQAERLRGEYVGHVREEFRLLKAKPDLHRARQLLTMLEAALGWEPEEINGG